ncbi:MAG: hypothetical protein FRX49_05428 [Trebouxia sp. A1-2]|nr:MAG: hypothetical protein FRX49_05428 [Trebouxia sp. A1-2]
MQDNQNLPHSPLRLDETQKLTLFGACDGIQNQGNRELSDRVNPVGASVHRCTCQKMKEPMRMLDTVGSDQTLLSSIAVCSLPEKLELPRDTQQHWGLTGEVANQDDLHDLPASGESLIAIVG